MGLQPFLIIIGAARLKTSCLSAISPDYPEKTGQGGKFSPADENGGAFQEFDQAD